MKEKRYVVYCHTLFDGRKYIGITSQRPQRRWRNGEGYKLEKDSYFYNAIKKYGWDAFEHEILFEGLTEEEAKSKEIELISKYKTQNRKNGFNRTGGGEGSYNPDEETRRRIGEWSRKVNTGRKHTEAYKQLMSKYMRDNNPNANGRLITEERRKKLAEYAKLPKTEKQKQKMSESAKKHPVQCVETGEVFKSMKEAASVKDICYTSLTCAVYDSHRRAGGYHWVTKERFYIANKRL